MALCAGIILALPPSAPATFPGKNGKIAFVRGLERIYTMRPDGSHVRPLVSFADEPDYSPSGRRILFVFRGRHGGLYTSRPDGTKRRHIPHTYYAAGDAGRGAFAPSGKRAVFVAYPPPYDDYLMYTIRLDGSHRHRIARDLFDPTFSPNGKWIAFDDGGRIGLMRANGRGKRLLTDDIYEFSDRAPDFSPDGRKIVFRRNGDDTSGIYTIRKDGTHLRRVYEATNINVSDPVFSPNGRKIAFARWRRREPGGTVHHAKLYTMRLDGTHLRRLSQNNDARRHSKPSWGVRP
jgi:Tol biopolymer transport system component